MRDMWHKWGKYVVAAIIFLVLLTIACCCRRRRKYRRMMKMRNEAIARGEDVPDMTRSQTHRNGWGNYCSRWNPFSTQPESNMAFAPMSYDAPSLNSVDPTHIPTATAVSNTHPTATFVSHVPLSTL